MSQSVGTRNFELVKDFISEVVERFAIGPQETRVAVVTYSDTAMVNFGFQNFTSREEVLDAVQSLTYGTYESTWVEVSTDHVINPQRACA